MGAFDGINKTLMINLLISSIFTVTSSYSGKVCHESEQSGVSLQESNKNFYYFIVFNIFLSLFLIGDSGLTVLNSVKSKESNMILPSIIYMFSSIISLTTSALAFDCYSRSIKETLGKKYGFLNIIFKGSFGVAIVLFLLLRHLIAPFGLLLLGINSTLASYLATKCYDKNLSDSLNYKYLNFSFYFSSIISSILLLNVIYTFYFN